MNLIPFLPFFVDSFQGLEFDFVSRVGKCHQNCFLNSCAQSTSTDEVSISQTVQFGLAHADDYEASVKQTGFTCKAI